MSGEIMQESQLDILPRTAIDEAGAVRGRSRHLHEDAGKRADALERRRKLAAALGQAKNLKCQVVVAKPIRPWRDAAFISGLMAPRVPFVVADLHSAPPAIGRVCMVGFGRWRVRAGTLVHAERRPQRCESRGSDCPPYRRRGSSRAVAAQGTAHEVAERNHSTPHRSA